MKFNTLKTYTLTQWTVFIRRVLIDQLFSLVWNMIAYMISSCWHLKSLLPSKRKIPYLPGINLYAYNSLFWLSAYNEIKRNGLKGKSTSAGDGDYDLTHWWFYTPVSLFAFRYLGVGLSFLCITFSPIGFFYNWENDALIALGLLFFFFSFPIVYSMAFVVGRYHSLAWLFVPITLNLGFFGVTDVLALMLVIIALTSSSVLFIMVVLIIAMAIGEQKMSLLLSIVPCVLVAAGYVVYLFLNFENGIGKIKSMLSSIGMLKRKAVKYKRSDVGVFSALDLWYLLSGFYYVFVSIFLFTEIPYLFLVAYLLFILNSKVSRFSDTQTLEYLIVVIGVFEISHYAMNSLALIALLPYISQAYLHKVGVGKANGQLKILKPLDICNELEKLKVIFNKIEKGGKVFIPFCDPKGQYSSLFDGYRHSIELPIFLGSISNSNVFPNWSMVFKYNYESSPEIWADDEQSIITRCQEWGADYVLLNVHKYDVNILYPIFETLGQYAYDLNDFDIWSQSHFKSPDWVLLKKNRYNDGFR